MNLYQRILLGLGLLLAILNGLFPPFIGKMRIEGDNEVPLI